MEQQIKEIDDEHIAIIETTVEERLVAKEVLLEQKKAKLKEIEDIDESLTYFKQPNEDD